MGKAAQDRYDRIADLTRRGVPTERIARALGVSIRTVNRGREARGCTLQPPNRSWTQEELDRAQGLLEDGACYGDVTETLGRGRTGSQLRHHKPGYAWSRQQVAQSGVLGKKFADLQRRKVL